MRFSSGKEMLEKIQHNGDFYSKEKEIYVFCYNSAGSIAYYDISNEEAEAFKEIGDYWSGYLGFGGSICDDPSHELYEEGDYSNLDWCNDNYEGEWEAV